MTCSVGRRKPYTKKNVEYLCPRVGEKCEQIKRLGKHHDVKTLCEVMNITRSTYYKHVKGVETKRYKENGILNKEILRIFTENKGRYGSIRISVELKKKGYKASVKRVLRLMKELEVRSTHRKKYRPL